MAPRPGFFSKRCRIIADVAFIDLVRHVGHLIEAYHADVHDQVMREGRGNHRVKLKEKTNFNWLILTQFSKSKSGRLFLTNYIGKSGESG
jgi:hypothetical protein